MSAESMQLIAVVFEISLVLAGMFLLSRLVFSARERARWLNVNQLPSWAVSPPEFALYVALILISGFFFQAGVQGVFGGALAKSSDRAGFELFAYGLGFHGGALLGWLLFRSLRASWLVGQGTGPPPPLSAPESWRKVIRYAGAGLLASLPVIYLANLGWVYLLRKLGLPDEPQDSIAIFTNTKSPFVVAGMLVVACGLAPLNEELLFRAGLYRFCRRKLGRSWALVLSGGLFGAVHLNWAGFLPLALLGAALALLYETTGSIRTAVVAHSMFNLMNVVFIVLGGPAQSP